MRGLRRIVQFIAILTILAASVSAERVISNSQDWRDVYSSMMYANLKGYPNNFLVSKRHSTLLLYSIPLGENIISISSRSVPQFVGYKSLLQGKGYIADEWVYDNINLDLLDRLPEIQNFVVIDDSYGYNAVSVAPYAVASQSYVLFADRNNIGDVTAKLSGRTAKKIIVYGHVEREVLDALSTYNPEVINYNGDRFLNNIEIVKRYQLLRNQKQAVLTNGEFIEQEIMSGVEPVLLLGAQNVPQSTQDYIKNSNIEVLVLIGNQYVGSATSIRRSTGASVFVKFAQGARVPSGPINPVEGLDMFYLPVVSLSLSIFSVEYNQATGMLEITIKNNVEQGTYFKGTYTINTAGGKQTVGDIDPLFIDGNGYRTILYPVDPIIGDATLDAFVIYGESTGSLEKTIEGTYNISIVKVEDSPELKIVDFFYDVPKKRFGIVLENTGKVDLYADVAIIDIIIANERVTLALKDTAFLKAGQRKTFYIESESRDEDIQKNPKVNVEVRYGERQEGLVKILKAELELKLHKVDYVFYGLVGTIVILIILIIFTKKKKCKHCGHMNNKNNKHCSKCGKEL